MTPEDYCRQKAAASGSSFYYSFFFLPPERRKAITALYAYCREVDDAVDECPDPQEAASRLAEWRKEIGRLYAGVPEHPVTRALFPFLARFDLPQEYFFEILEGMEMDIDPRRYPDFNALSLYCHRVASAVGLLSIGIFGQANAGTRDYARALGMALQLTNIVRDIAEDAARGRIYLPLEDLARFGVTEQDILERRDSENFRRLVIFQVERAEQFYARAMEALPKADRKTQCPGLIMAAIYRATLNQIKRAPEVVLKRRLSLCACHKIGLAALTWIRA